MRISIIIILIIICQAIRGTNYFVSNEGNDLNSGISDAQTWAHHPWMSTWTGSTILNAGDTVFMKRGGKWSITAPSAPYLNVKQSGTNGNHIVTTWYGSGNKPIIEITGNFDYPVIKVHGKSYITFDHLEIKHWNKTQNRSNRDGIQIREEGNNIPHDVTVTNCDIYNIPGIGINSWDDSYNILIGDSSASICASKTSHSNHIYDCGYAGVGLNGRNPLTGFSYFLVYFNYIHDINSDGSVGDNAYAIFFSVGLLGAGPGYSSGFPSHCLASYNYIENVNLWHGLNSHGGRKLYFTDNYISNCKEGIFLAIADYTGGETPHLDSCYIQRNIIEQPGNHPISGLRFGFITIATDNALLRPTNCIVSDNNLFYTTRPTNELNAYGIIFYHVDGITVERNKIYNGPVGVCVGAIVAGWGTSHKNKNVIIRNNWIYNWSNSIRIATGNIDGNIECYDNIACSHLIPFVVSDGTISNGNLNLFNNVFLNTPGASTPRSVDFSLTFAIGIGASVIIKNNIIGFTTSTSTGRYIVTPNINNGTLNIDQNLYWNSSRPDPYYMQGTRNWASWNNLGYDINGFNNTNPLFRNVSGSYSQDLDFELQSNSPAIEKGIFVGLLTDYLGSSINGTPDIGAFENQAGSYTPSYISSVIENANPTLLEIIFNSALAEDKIPNASAFIVNVNGIPRNVTKVTVSGNKVILTLASAVFFGNSVNVSYNKPGANWIESNSGSPATSISNQSVINNCKDPDRPNALPVIDIDFPPAAFSGFVYDLNASQTLDPDNDVLTFIWTVPPDVPVSETMGSKISFLTPVVTKPEILTFSLRVYDGRDSISQNIQVNLMPYKPDLGMAKIEITEASDYYQTDYPDNIGDGNLSTKWSANGDNQWLTMSLAKPFRISYVQGGFLPDQKYESYFDLYASRDNLTWDPVFIRTSSCSFSGALQNFEFPLAKSFTEYSYLKFIGHGNSVDTWNNISEFKIFGGSTGNSSANDGNISVYPNPATDLINVLVLEPPSIPQQLRIYNSAGILQSETKLDPGVNYVQIPINLSAGIYIVQVILDKLIMFVEKLVVVR